MRYIYIERERKINIVMDLRQVIAAFLTLSMFAMLGNMIKRDHFDSLQMKSPTTLSGEYDATELTKQRIVKLSSVSKEPWEENGKVLRPCWNKPTPIYSCNLSLIVSKIANAVVVAGYLGATIVLPDIRGSKPGEKRNFEEIYDVKRLIRNLDGVITIAKYQPMKASSTIVRVPNWVSEDYIAANVEPLFRWKKILKLETYFPSLTMTKGEKTGYLDSYSCLGLFGILQLQPGMQELVDSMVGRLGTLSQKSKGRFIALDLGKVCWESGVMGRSCYNAWEIGEFLKRIGFHRDTTIYLTQSGWHRSLDALRDIYPRTYTKQGIMPADKKAKFLNAESSEFEKLVDFHICSQSDVFIPAFSGLFYANVAGKRIAYGKRQILVPAQITSTSSTDYISPYISNKSHLAYSCFC
ncbi:protein MANNAN SYNTHESIS-RELATED 1-like [Cornus florida]|uniref:protein MANNAN SYNTHESIS-RELATED 1-like n=1 Tax=Cornus florida TaxID=4283 RepID=UPI00289BAA8D|nr:protein MANNAN SYNTHESIS-RELATED 1-like [Cornus florida]